MSTLSFNTPLTDAFLVDLRTLLQPADLLMGPEDLERFCHDETEDLRFPPQVVVQPRTTEQVAAVVKICAAHHVPITPMGARTGLSGGALAVYGGVGLSMAKMDAIIAIDEKNLQVTVEPGVITQVLQEAVAAKGLYYAPDPSSRGSCTIGGNLAENAGGPRAVKYGVTRDFVLNLEVVLPNGEVVWTGANTLKNSTGYDLTRLISRQRRHPRHHHQSGAALNSPSEGNALDAGALPRCAQCLPGRERRVPGGITPSALEFMERDAIDWTMRFTEGCLTQVADDTAAHLLIEVDGNHGDVLLRDCETILGVMEKFGGEEVLFAETSAEKDALWKLRRSVPVSREGHSVYKEEDTVVPRYELPNLLAGVKAMVNEVRIQKRVLRPCGRWQPARQHHQGRYARCVLGE
jgi:glycolate oxidase